MNKNFQIDADSEITGPIEEKVFSNATMDDDFADDQVIVIMTNSASLKFKEYTVVDFSEIPCNKVRDLMPTATAKAEAKEKGLDVVSLFRSADNAVVTSDFYDIDTSSFRQILCLTLSDPGKENVLAAIKALENRTDVYYAGPAYTVKLCSESSGELAYFNQTALNKVQLPQAWNMVTKSNTVYVGIVDTGIDNTHPDLYGIVDVTKSRSYANHSASALVDTDGHGTGVAGVVGMVTNEISGTSGNN